MPKVSIILPIYNVENYLRKCIDSVLAQTLEDIEVILATDGPESCDKICEEYTSKDSRVKIVMHPGSYGKAFNKSLEIATGEYIGIVETDDWLDLTMYEKMYNKAKLENADVVKCGFWFAFDDENKNFTVLYDEYEEVLDINKQQNFLSSQPSVWSCIYKKDFLLKNNMQMIEKRQSFIDVPFHYESICKAKKYVLIKEPLYYYYQDNSNQTVQNVKVYDGLNSEMHGIKLVGDYFNNIKEGMIYSTALHLKWNYDRLNKTDKKELIKEAHKFVKTLQLKDVQYIYFEKPLKLFFDLLANKEKFDFESEQKKLIENSPKNIFQLIFSIKNNDIHKVFTILGLKLKIRKDKFKNFIQNIFSIKNEYIHKVFCILGIKLKIKSNKLIERKISIEHLNLEILNQKKENFKKTKEIKDLLKELVDKTHLITNMIEDLNSRDLELNNLKKELNNKNTKINDLTSFLNKFTNVLDLNKNDSEILDYDISNDDSNLELYNEEFYKINAKESYDSAMKIINILKKYYLPNSVLDLGCGVGTWLKAWRDNGTSKVLGFDTNAMPENALYIPSEMLKRINFETEEINIDSEFDLAMSLECFEHISAKNEDSVFNTLTKASDLILFSAAIPYQVGTNHINCHKLSYWVNKFKNKGYSCYDIIRPECLKYSLDVGPWYMQNILVFARNNKKEILENNGAIPIETPIMFYHSENLRDILIVNSK